MFDPTCMAAALAHELREQSRFPSGQPRISPEKAREIVAAALRSQPVEAGEACPEPMCNEAGKCMCPGACLRYPDAVQDFSDHIASLSQQPAPEVVELLRWMDGQHRLELSHQHPTYCDDDDQVERWQVHRVGGSINDREWTLIGEGETVLAAIRAARARIDAAIQQGERG